MIRLKEDMETIKDKNMLSTQKTTYRILSRRSTSLNEKLQRLIDEESFERYDFHDSDWEDSDDFSD